jgi:riboflavin kinase
MRRVPETAVDAQRRNRRSLKLTGTVVRGLGESASFLSIPWVANQITSMLNFSAYPGTLNIDVHSPGVQKTLKRHGTERIVPAEEGFCDALVFKGTVAGRYPCGVILPLVPGYPASILEIVAPVHLKQALGAADGDGVELEIYISFAYAV